jgi:hypothetical protein
MDNATRVRGLALILGWLGVLPFAGLAIAAVFDVTPGRGFALGALVIYAAAILSFLGGVTWGLTLAPGARSAPRPDTALVVGVTMSLIGFFAALAPVGSALLVRAPAFVVMLVYDLRLTRGGFAPDWFAPMRVRLTTAAVLSLLAGAYIA